MANLMENVADGPMAEISRNLDWLERSLGDARSRLACASEAGGKLAAEVYRFTQDPEGVGTDALEAAYGSFMALSSANFYPDGGRA